VKVTPNLQKKKNQILPTIPLLPDIELTPLKTSTPTSRIAPPALIKGRLNEILRFCCERFRAIREGVWFEIAPDGVDLWLLSVKAVSSLGLKDEMLLMLSIDEKLDLGGARRDGVFWSEISQSALVLGDIDGIAENGLVSESDGLGDTSLVAAPIVGSWRDNDGEEERQEAALIAQDLAIDTVGAIICSCSTLRVKESRKMFSSDELDFHFDDVGEGVLTGKDEEDPFGIRLGGGDGDGVLLREHRGKGKSWVSSSSSIGEERSRLRKLRASGPGSNSSMVDTDDTVELEDVSRSRGFTRGYSELPEEEAKGDAEEWDCCVRIRSVSSML
jgi:hypothetical protein